MPKQKRTKLNPLGTVPSSLRKARAVTSEFHRLTHEQSLLRRTAAAAVDTAAAGGHSFLSAKTPASSSSSSLYFSSGAASTASAAALSARERELQSQLDALGGRRAYQDASRIAVSAFKSSRHVFRLLTQFGLRPGKGQPPLEALEVGAINAHLCVPWLRVSGIDLMSRHPRIRQLDFFAVRPRGAFDCLVNSMVINCVECPRARGRMLLLCFAHLKPGGHCFLNLPRRCVENSRFITRATFEAMLAGVGFELRDITVKPKVIMYCLRRPVGSGDCNQAAAAVRSLSSAPASPASIVAAVAVAGGKRSHSSASGSESNPDFSGDHDSDSDDISDDGNDGSDDRNDDGDDSVGSASAPIPASKLELFSAAERNAPLPVPVAIRAVKKLIQNPPVPLGPHAKGTDFAVSFAH
jgi:25S rRNA (adenine2142-N1)-methyltransferase